MTPQAAKALRSYLAAQRRRYRWLVRNNHIVTSRKLRNYIKTSHALIKECKND